jgi:hypothetical protein
VIAEQHLGQDKRWCLGARIGFIFLFFFTFVDIRKDGTNWSRRAVEVLKKHKRAMAIAVLELNCHGYICSEHQEATVFHSCRAHNI